MTAFIHHTPSPHQYMPILLETIPNHHFSHLQSRDVLMQSFQLLIRTPDAEDGAMSQRILDHVVEHVAVTAAHPAELRLHACVQHDDLVLDVSVVHYRQPVLPEAIHQQEEGTSNLEVVPVPALLVVAGQDHEADGTEDFLGVA